MAETTATILIPDISGFTEFVTTTELTHSSRAINMLINAMVDAVGEDYDVSEIEGDAVLLIRKGAAPSQKEIHNTCLKIFNAFHFRRSWMQQYTICPCGACRGLVNLTLKFVVHHGPLAEIKVGRFVKHSGTEMIVAHRLLKNGINNNEYLLLTEKLLTQSQDSPEVSGLEWASASEEYSSIGKVPYRFTLLTEARKNVPQPPAPQNHYRTDDTAYFELGIKAHFMDVYMTIMNIPGRAEWMPELQEVEQEAPDVFVGSVHHCRFQNYSAIVSPLQMRFSGNEIVYAESCIIKELSLSLVHEFVFKNIDNETTNFATRFINTGEGAISEEVRAVLSKQMQQTAEKMKAYCEKQ